jgi:hypothetical protein
LVRRLQVTVEPQGTHGEHVFFLAAAASMAVLLGRPTGAQASEVFDDRGFKPNRDYFSQLPFEHIDPVVRAS